jgi:hypothetical protein
MRSRVVLRVLLSLVAAALAAYAGLYAYTGHRYAHAFADTALGDSPDTVIARFGVEPNVETVHSGWAVGFTMQPCAALCDERLWWHDPTTVIRPQAYYFVFDSSRHLISKTHYEHLDETYLRCMEELKRRSSNSQRSGPFSGHNEMTIFTCLDPANLLGR